MPVKKSVKKIKTKKTTAGKNAEKKAPQAAAEYFEAVGRRKTAVARVRLFGTVGTGGGNFTVNGKDLNSYFPAEELRVIARSPFERTKTDKSVFLSAKIYGGGIRSQAEALRHGISRALLKYRPELRQILKSSGFLTRDARQKERRKFGLKKARKAPQWSKR